MSHRLCVSPSAAQRLDFASGFLRALPAASPALLIVPSPAAGTHLVAAALAPGEARFGWRRRSLYGLARELALPELAREGRVPLRGLAIEALVTRVVHALGAEAGLGCYARLCERPGFVRTLGRTLDELRLAAVAPDALAHHAPELARVLDAYTRTLAELALADRAHVYAAALRAHPQRPSADVPLLALDVPLETRCEEQLAAALCEGRPAVGVTVARGDEHSEARWRFALGAGAELVRSEPLEHSDLARLQLRLFAGRGGAVPHPALQRGAVTIVSSPGEAREAVELARAALALAAEGVPFDRMAILLRAAEGYRAVLEEALARAQIPAHFADGVRRPRVEGRALLALLACARDGLSASAFAEYLSLGVVPGPAQGSPVEVPSPRKWERMLVEAAVIGGRERWARRLAGLAASRLADEELLDPDDPRRATLAQERAQLLGLTAFALPLLDQLAALPEGGTWGAWIAALGALAKTALREPDAVIALLEELAPLSPLGPVGVRTVHRVLAPRLSSVVQGDAGLGAGKLFVGTIDDARGRVFEAVFVPGLAERMFPQRISEDALLPDAIRTRLGAELLVTDERVARERLLLRLAVGAASTRLCLSFPRFDLANARPRVPSFYGLEVLEAIDGKLPAFDELTRRALPGAAARLGFPAPDAPEQAIDDAEYDLAMLARLIHASTTETGAARYLLEASQPLARALRFRARRWEVARFLPVDGFVADDPAGRALLAPYRLAQRAYSASALSHFAVCPYRFYLHAIVGLAPRPELLGADELDARQRGVLFHRVQRALLERLRGEGLLPLQADRLAAARALLAEVFEAQARAARDDFAPSIDQVFEACLRGLRSDLDAWLTRLAEDTRFAPGWFELGFGLPPAAERDAHSRSEPVRLALGPLLRGAIDLVEIEQPEGEPRRLRATDHKTSAAPAQLGTVEGGRSLQPLLYALALEPLFPEAKVVAGRLWFCTARGEFRSFEVPLHDGTRGVAGRLFAGIDALIEDGCLPAAPAPLPKSKGRSECDHCPYLVVCGPDEPDRFRVKARDYERIKPLFDVRKLP